MADSGTSDGRSSWSEVPSASTTARTAPVRGRRSTYGGGRKPIPYSVIVLGVTVLAGLFALMVRGDEERVYRELGRRINHAKLQVFDPFLACALDLDPQVLRSNAELEARLAEQLEVLGPAWPEILQQECLPRLEGLDEELAVLIAPDSLKPHIQVLTRSSRELRTGFQELATYLAEPGAEQAVAAQKAQRVIRPWYDFRRAHGQVNRILRAKLQSSASE